MVRQVWEMLPEVVFSSHMTPLSKSASDADTAPANVAFQNTTIRYNENLMGLSHRHFFFPVGNRSAYLFSALKQCLCVYHSSIQELFTECPLCARHHVTHWWHGVLPSVIQSCAVQYGSRKPHMAVKDWDVAGLKWGMPCLLNTRWTSEAGREKECKMSVK